MANVGASAIMALLRGTVVQSNQKSRCTGPFTCLYTHLLEPLTHSSRFLACLLNHSNPSLRESVWLDVSKEPGFVPQCKQTSERTSKWLSTYDSILGSSEPQCVIGSSTIMALLRGFQENDVKTIFSIHDPITSHKSAVKKKKPDLSVDQGSFLPLFSVSWMPISFVLYGLLVNNLFLQPW